MNKKINKKLYFRVAILFVSIALSFAGVASASQSTVEGVIGGANCIVTKGTCPMNSDDPHIALEREFVLSVPGGNYYFLPNISRSLKTSYLNKPVRITGDLRSNTLVVAAIEVKEDGAYREVWNWKKLTTELNRGN